MPVPKISRYNYFVERPEGIVAYNARTGVFALLASDVANRLVNSTQLDSINDEAALVEMGFLHYGDEIDKIAARFKEQRELKFPLHLTLLPTLACNYKCQYCFQGDYRQNQIMTVSVQEASIRFLVNKISEGRSDINITWFGGEPLLCKEIILSMSPRLQDVVAKAGAQLELTIITNGTLLDKSTAQALSKVGVSAAQITIDALRYEKGRKRGVLDKQNQPSPIFTNACTAREYMRIEMRVNVSQENKNDIPRILEILRANNFGNDITLARVDDCVGEGTPFTVKSNADTNHSGFAQYISASFGDGHGLSLPRTDYANFELDVLLDNPENLEYIARKLRPRGQFCSATANYMYVIDPVGNISRCWHSAGVPSEAMGSVFDEEEELENSRVASLVQDYTPLSYPSCVSCKILPLCMGGCSHARLYRNADSPPCEAIKQQIEFCVNQVASHIEITKKQRSLLAK